MGGTKKKLSELAAVFFDYRGQGEQAPRQSGVGLGLDCPCGCAETFYIGFANPLEGPPTNDGAPKWQRIGDSIDVLTLTPSVQRMSKCRWHGFVTNGEAVEC